MGKKPLVVALLASAAAVAVVLSVVMWSPTPGASPIVALGSDTAVIQGSAASAEVPLLAPDTADDAPVAGSAGLAAAAVEVTAARTFAGGQLASNAGLTLSATARELLVGGRVDARGILSLGQYLGQTQLAVADFPLSDAGTGTGVVRRQILLSGLAGVPLGTGASTADSAAAEGASASVEAWFRALSAPVNVESVVRTSTGVLVTFAPGEPTSLLPSPAPSL